MKKYKKRICTGIVLGFLILISSAFSIVSGVAEDVTLNQIQPTTAGSFRQISWNSTGTFEPNANLELFDNGILNRPIVSGFPLFYNSYYWAVPLSLQGMYQIKITATNTIGQEVINATDIELTIPTADSCRYCHTTTGTSNSGVFNNTLGSMATRHHNVKIMGRINPLTNKIYGCPDCHPVFNSSILIERNCLNCHNGTAFWANPLYINPGEPHLKIPQPVPIINSVALSTYTPDTGDSIQVTVNVTDGITITNVSANEISLTRQSNNIWNGSITAIEGTHSVNVLVRDSIGQEAWDNSTSYTAITPNIIITSPMTGDRWVRGTTQTIRWNYVGDLGSSATVELLEQGIVHLTWNKVPQSNGAGSLDWAIPSQFEVSRYRIRVSAGSYSNTTGNFDIVKK